MSKIKNIFSSTLYIDLDSTYEKSLNGSNEESENVETIDIDIKEESFLIKELIKELDSPESDIIKLNSSFNNNKIKSDLVNNGYKFVPKKYRNDTKNNCSIKYNDNNVDNVDNSLNNNKYKFKSKKGKKDDWICKYCFNLNFAFRKKCNRCKVPKINKPIKKNIKY